MSQNNEEQPTILQQRVEDAYRRFEEAAGFPPSDTRKETIKREVVEAVTQEAIHGSDATPYFDLSEAIPGGDWGQDIPEVLETVWGRGEKAYWPSGELTIPWGSDGTHKTTIAHYLVAGMLSFPGRETLMGLDIRPLPEDKCVVYLALDRPRQIERSWARFIDEDTRPLAKDRLVVWPKGLPFDAFRHPDRLLPFIEQLAQTKTGKDPGAVVLDNVTDAFGDMADTEKGTVAAIALNNLIRHDIETLAPHHNRKSNGKPSYKAPRSDDEMYGARNFKGRSGSNFSLWKPPGGSGSVVTITQHKEPSDKIAEATYYVDLKQARFLPMTQLSLEQVIEIGEWFDLARASQAHHRTADPSKEQKEKTRYALQKLADKGVVEVRKDGDGGTARTLWRKA